MRSRYITILLLAGILPACDLNAKIEITTDTSDPTDTDPDTDADTGGTPGTTMRRVLHVEADGMPFAGYAVGGVPFGLSAMTNPGDDAVYAWTVDSTAYRAINVPPDPSDFSYAGPAGTYAGIGTLSVAPTGMMTSGFSCVGADYDSTVAASGGKLSCFRDAKVFAGSNLTDADADLIVYGGTPALYLGEEALSADVDGDGVEDLVVGGGTSGTIYVLSALWEEVGLATTFPVVKTVPGDESLSIVACDVDGDGLSDTDIGHCKPLAVGDGRMLVTDAYNLIEGAILETWLLPLTATSVAENRVIASTTNFPVGSKGAWTDFGWVVNDASNSRFLLYDATLTGSTEISLPAGSEAWGVAVDTVGTDPWIALGGSEYDVGGVPVGAVYAANLATGMITDWSEADYVGTGTGGNKHCGWSVAFGKTTDDIPTVAMGCYHPEYIGGRGSETFVLEPEPAGP